METDAKGQLGGLECTKEERERLAASSKAWRCTVCMKSNKEILDESSEAARKAEEENGGPAPKEDEVPELKGVYTDEKKATDASSSGEAKADGDDDAQLAEGFVQTGNVGSTADAATTNLYPPARPAQTVPQPTLTIPQAAAIPPRVTAAPAFPPPPQAQMRALVRSNDGVPIWLDRTIAAVVLALIAMVLKVLFGL